MIRRHGSLLRALLMLMDGTVAVMLVMLALGRAIVVGEPQLRLPYPAPEVAAVAASMWVALV
jgi:hypothetical protein